MAKYPIRPNCEAYRKQVQKYFGDMTPVALFVADKESKGCTAKVSTKANSNGTYDYCIFQINDEPSTSTNLDLCIKRAYQKYLAGRIGDKNFSAWYAVCTNEAIPRPKYAGIDCV